MSVQTLVEVDQLKLLYHQSHLAVYVSLVAAAMLMLILWLNLYSVNALYWFGAIIVTTFSRAMLFGAYKVIGPEYEDVLRWRTPYFLTLALSSLVWGLGVVWILPAESLVYQLVCFLFLMGMAGGALAYYYAIRSFVIFAQVLLLVPVSVWMFVEGNLTGKLVSLAALVYMLSTVRAAYVLSGALQQSFLLTHELTLAKESAEDMARTDSLTGLSNRRAFMELARQSVNQCRRDKQPVTVILIDIDHFKKLNDSYGHAMGDLALQQVAKVIAENLRESDICARLGGEEFVVLMPNTSLEGGLSVAEKLRATIEFQDWKEYGIKGKMTASLGVSWGKDSTTDELLAKADKAMYLAKRSGRNRVCS